MKRPSATEDAGAIGTAPLRGYFASLARYHLWATAKLCEHVERLEEAHEARERWCRESRKTMAELRRKEEPATCPRRHDRVRRPRRRASRAARRNATRGSPGGSDDGPGGHASGITGPTAVVA